MSQLNRSGLAILLAGAGIPFTLWRSAQIHLQTANQACAREAQRLAQLTAENQRLSNLLAQVKTAEPLKTGQLTELLGLRNEIARLRGESHEIQMLREENRRLQAGQPDTAGHLPGEQTSAQMEAQLSAQTVEAMRNICRELPAALERFAAGHANQAPSFSDLRDYFPAVNGRRMPGLYTFNFVRENGPQPGDTLILSEESSRTRADGKEARVYGFSDGTAVEVVLENFESWEKQHLTSAPPANKAHSSQSQLPFPRR